MYFFKYGKKPRQIKIALFQVAEKDMGGSSGAMYSLFFESAAVECEKGRLIDAELFGKAFGLGLDAIMKYGRAQPGDRTMVDALYPAFSPDYGLLENLKYIEGAVLWKSSKQ